MSRETPSLYASLLKKYDLPDADGDILEVVFRMDSGDWWHRTDAGWFWIRGDGSKTKWAPSFFSPRN